MQAEFTSLQGTIHEFTDLKQEFEQLRVFNLKKVYT